jgi:toxin-antitoxin system PIN domain toxin
MPDVNVLIYAHRADDPAHTLYRTWLEDRLNGNEPLALSVLVAVAFVRITTNRTVFADPTPLGAALGAVDAIADHPNCRVLAPGPRHLEIFGALCRASRATGKTVADAQHAALALEHGCEWVTRDQDFAKFADLRWQFLAPS